MSLHTMRWIRLARKRENTGWREAEIGVPSDRIGEKRRAEKANGQ